MYSSSANLGKRIEICKYFAIIWCEIDTLQEKRWIKMQVVSKKRWILVEQFTK
jgi:hypothetical protein